LLVAACEARPPAVPEEAPAVAPLATATAGQPEALRTAERLAAHHPQLAQLMRPHAGVWAQEAGGLTSPGWRASAHRAFDQLGARLPALASGVTAVGLSRIARFQLRLAAEGAQPATASEHDGRVLYRDVYPSTDVVFVVTEQRLEELLLLRDAAAPREFAWTIKVPHGLPRTRLEADGALAFLDARDEAVLRIPRPFAVDARGTRRWVAMDWRAGRLVLRLDTAGLTYPILLDPAIETAVWELKQPSMTPFNNDEGMAFDSARGRTVVVRGWALAGVDTYLWDGTDWVMAAPATKPTRRQLTALAFDSQRQVAVLFSGWTWSTTIQDTWEWNGTNWTLRSSSGPSPRARHTMAYDSTRHVTVLFGGWSTATGSAPLNDTWEWNGTTWTQRATSGPPATTDSEYPPRMAYDQARQHTVLVTAGQTWVWNGTTWTQKAVATPAGYFMAYDAARQRVLQVSANGAGDIVMWEWDGAVWTQITPAYPCDRGQGCYPGGFRLAYDSTRRRTVVIGGWTYEGGVTADTWEYHSRGGACASDAACDTFHCVDSVCCEQASCGTCQACDTAGGPGTCLAVTNADDDTCTGNTTCDDAGACKLKLGKSCGTDGDCASHHCDTQVGVCCALACGTCQTCNATGTACDFVVSADDPDSCTGDTTCDSTSQCTRKLGRTCTYDTDCASGHCADQVCCDEACASLCRTCKAAYQASGTDGVCGPVKAGDDPRGVCADEGPASCGQDGACAGNGTCRLYAGGTTCAATACVGSDVTTSTCNGAGACLAAGTPCAPWGCAAAACTTTCASGVDCAAGAWCDAGTCRTKSAPGAACATPDACLSGACVEGVCCDGSCTGKCQACTAMNKVAGPDGECGFARAGVDPHGDCPDDGPASCDRDGTCDGQGQCRVYPAGFVCLTTGCDGNVATGYQCDGSGTCAGVAPQDCGRYRCVDGACTTSCAADADCAADAYCEALSSTCVAKQAAGAGCSAARECASGYCADGVCCDRECTGQCEYCALTTAVGTCSPVSGPAPSGRAPCPGATSADPCTARACDGTQSTATCAGWVGTEVVCRAGACAGGVELLAATCDGSGVCPPASEHPCEPYACAGTTCRGDCTVDADCADPARYTCEVSTHRCEARRGAECDGHVVQMDDGTEVDCRPYVCQVETTGAACMTSCSATSECVEGYVCDTLQGQGTCVPAAGGGGGSSGGCRVAGRGDARRSTLIPLTLLVALLAWRRRGPVARRRA
jgi:hypothetical protein